MKTRKIDKNNNFLPCFKISNSYFNRLNITLYKVILHPLLEYNKLENKFSKLASNPQKPKRSKRKIVHNNPRLHNFIPRKLKNRVSSRPTYKGSFISGITSVVYDVIQGTKLSNRGHSAEQSAARMHTEVAMKPNTEI